VLFLEFDASGVLSRRDLVSDGEGVDRYCAESGLCQERGWPNLRMRCALQGCGLDDETTTVTASGAAKAGLGWPMPDERECVVVIWPDATWKKGSMRDAAPGGVPVMIDTIPESRVAARLPAESFAVMALPAGEHIVQATSPWVDPYLRDALQHETSAAEFTCTAGEQVYLAIGASTNKGNRFPILLKRVEEAAAQALIANMPRVLLP
jgi:hypothetical protein